MATKLKIANGKSALVDNEYAWLALMKQVEQHHVIEVLIGIKNHVNGGQE